MMNTDNFKYHTAGRSCNYDNYKQPAKINTEVKKQATPAHTYSFYSNVLKKPFASVEELEKAEDVYFEEQQAKEDKATQKKADAQKVEDAFKALNAARKVYKEDLNTLAKEYSEKLEELTKTFEFGKKDITSKLTAAEDAYAKALKEFTDKYGQYHFSFKGDDFETTISGSSGGTDTAKVGDIFDIFDCLFKF